MMKTYLRIISVIAVFYGLLTGCKGGGAESTLNGEGSLIEDARFLKIDSLAPDQMHVKILNPWDSTALMADYLMINSGAKEPAVIEGAKTVTLPLKRLVVFSSIHAALLCELGYADAIVGVADVQYIKTPEILERIADGRIADVGSSTQPSLETIIALKPDALLVSPFQNSGHGVIDKSGIQIIDCADYMETTPLGRAEWSKFYAMLVEGVQPSNSAMFKGVKGRYNALKQQWANTGEKPRVLTEIQNRGTWMVPGGSSFAAQMIADAGGEYPFADDHTPGSLQLSYPKVLSSAQNCDFWLLKSLDDISLNDVAENHPLNNRFWAYSHNGVYNANTTKTAYYEETPFHPDLLLTDYVNIFHHTGKQLRYFAPVK